MALAGGLLTALGTVQGAVAHVRGSDYQGHTDPAAFQQPWPSSGPPVLWRRRVGDGYSGIIVAEERVYSQAQTLAGQFVVCLDLATGAEMWRTRCH